MTAKTNSWFHDISAYFQFVNARRPDNRFGIVTKTMQIFGLAFVAFIIALVIFADPLFLAWVNEPGRQIPTIFQIITRLGKVHWVLIPTGIALIILSIFNARRFKGAKNVVWHRLFLNAWFAFTAIAYSGLLVILCKNIFGRARPPIAAPDNIWLFQPFSFQYEFASFPSGHATTGAAIAMVLMLLFTRWRWVFLLAGLLIALSRPVLGVHFPSDITAGVLLGAGFVWIYARIFAQKRLLFKFDDNGKLQLRGEGRGQMHLFGEMVRDVLRPGKGDK